MGCAVEKLVLRPGAAESFGDGGGSTSPSRSTVEDRSLRSCLQTAQVTSVMFLQDPQNRMRLEIFLAVGQCLRAWHGTQSQTLRCAGAPSLWIAEQAGRGTFFEHIHDMLKTFS